MADSVNDDESDIKPTRWSNTKEIELAVFSGDPILRALARKRVDPHVLLVVPVAILLMGLLISLSDGDLAQPALAHDLCHDIARFMPGSPRWSCLSEYRTDIQFSYLRDLPTLMLLLAAGLIPRLIYKQWLGLRDVFPTMYTNRLMSFTSNEGMEKFHNEVQSANLYFQKIGRCGSLLALGAAFLASPVVAAEHYGVFPLYFGASETGRLHGQFVYENWWASFGHPIAWTFYLFIVALGAYYVILMNMIGSRVVILLWRVRKFMVISASAENVDGSFGWHHAREVLAASYLATALYALVLSGMSVLLPVRVLWVLSLFFFQWLVVLPFYLWIPLKQVRVSINEYKRSETARITERINQIVNSADTSEMQERDLLADRLERIRKIRALPFRAFRDVVTALFTILAGAGSIYAVVTLWYNLT